MGRQVSADHVDQSLEADQAEELRRSEAGGAEGQLSLSEPQVLVVVVEVEHLGGVQSRRLRTAEAGEVHPERSRGVSRLHGQER